jgi:hypothetical protein
MLMHYIKDDNYNYKFNRDGGRSEEKRCYAVNSKRNGGRSEEKRHYAVNSKQKLSKNLFLVGSFLTC